MYEEPKLQHPPEEHTLWLVQPQTTPQFATSHTATAAITKAEEATFSRDVEDLASRLQATTTDTKKRCLHASYNMSPS
jgi:hypothetical protein